MQTGYRDNYATTCGLVDEGTNANTFKTTQAVSHSLNGFGYYKAATDNLAFSAGHTALGNSQRCAFFICLDASGTVTTLQSQIVTPSPTGDQRAAAEDPESQRPYGHRRPGGDDRRCGHVHPELDRPERRRYHLHEVQLRG